MGDTWITDMTHFFDVHKPAIEELPGPARRFATYLGEIISIATQHSSGMPIDTEIRCRRRPGRKPCKGHIHLIRNDIPSEILWTCTECDDKGVIRGWKKTPWDNCRYRRR